MERELMLLERLIDEPKEYSFYEIMERSQFSREPTYRHLQRLVQRGFVEKKRIGNIYLYSINMKNELLHPILSFLHMRKLDEKEREIVSKIQPDLPGNTLFAYIKDGTIVVGYSGKPELDSLFKKAEKLGLKVRGIEAKNFRKHIQMKGLKMIRGAKVFFNGERFFHEIAEAILP